jgi:hypothetical protein
MDVPPHAPFPVKSLVVTVFTQPGWVAAQQHHT